jgi:hypothetical protein
LYGNGQPGLYHLTKNQHIEKYRNMTVEEIKKLAEQYDIEGDGAEYEVLLEQAERVKDVPGIVCEIGGLWGFGTFLLMNAMGNDKKYLLIDPYGNIPYDDVFGSTRRWNYSNKVKATMMMNIGRWCAEKEYDFYFYPMTDLEFMRRFADGIPVFDENPIGMTEYCLVHVDGPHTTPLVMRETEFFIPRVALGGAIVFDDIGQYDHRPVDQLMKVSGFRSDIHGRTHKWSYVKEKHIL